MGVCFAPVLCKRRRQQTTHLLLMIHVCKHGLSNQPHHAAVHCRSRHRCTLTDQERYVMLKQAQDWTARMRVHPARCSTKQRWELAFGTRFVNQRPMNQFKVYRTSSSIDEVVCVNVSHRRTLRDSYGQESSRSDRLPHETHPSHSNPIPSTAQGHMRLAPHLISPSSASPSTLH